jgi:heme oxygenase (biliverdin-producing, ferredoxin)
MSNLRELTHDAHKAAETSPFVKILFSGKIDPHLYATYLKNQHPMYEILEVCAMAHGLLNGLPDVRRAPGILSDFQELWTDTENQPTILPVVDRYIKYILSIKDDPKKLMAHMYVRHMGDLAGGQMIAKRVPGAGKYYHFEDPNSLKAAIREKISDDMADEARVCFQYAKEFFEEMMTQVDAASDE